MNSVEATALQTQIKDESCDIIDLDLHTSPEDLVYEWDAKIKMKLKSCVVADSEHNLDTLMRWYIQTMNEEALLFEDYKNLKLVTANHLKFFKMYFVELNCCFMDNYLDNMEEILTFCVNLEVKCQAVKQKGTNKRSYKKLASHIISMLSIYLQYKEDRIYHVLMKLKLDLDTEETKALLNSIYRTFLTREPNDKSDLEFCRAYILYQKWKMIRKPDDWEQMDEIMYTLHDRTVDDIKLIPLLEKILLPRDILTVTETDISQKLKIILEEYFKYIKCVKVEDELNICAISDIELQDDLSCDAEEEQLEKAYRTFVKNMSSMCLDNNKHPNQHSHVKEENASGRDDCKIVGVNWLGKEPAGVDVIHEILDDDDDIEIIYIKRKDDKSSSTNNVTENTPLHQELVFPDRNVAVSSPALVGEGAPILKEKNNLIETIDENVHAEGPRETADLPETIVDEPILEMGGSELDETLEVTVPSNATGKTNPLELNASFNSGEGVASIEIETPSQEMESSAVPLPPEITTAISASLEGVNIACSSDFLIAPDSSVPECDGVTDEGQTCPEGIAYDVVCALPEAQDWTACDGDIRAEEVQFQYPECEFDSAPQETDNFDGSVEIAECDSKECLGYEKIATCDANEEEIYIPDGIVVNNEDLTYIVDDALPVGANVNICIEDTLTQGYVSALPGENFHTDADGFENVCLKELQVTPDGDDLNAYETEHAASAESTSKVRFTSPDVVPPSGDNLTQLDGIHMLWTKTDQGNDLNEIFCGPISELNGVNGCVNPDTDFDLFNSKPPVTGDSSVHGIVEVAACVDEVAEYADVKVCRSENDGIINGHIKNEPTKEILCKTPEESNLVVTPKLEVTTSTLQEAEVDPFLANIDIRPDVAFSGKQDREVKKEEKNNSAREPEHRNDPKPNLIKLPSSNRQRTKKNKIRISNAVVNLKSLERYHVSPYDTCLRSTPCVIVERLADSEIRHWLKVSRLCRKARLQEEKNRYLSSIPVEATYLKKRDLYLEPCKVVRTMPEIFGRWRTSSTMPLENDRVPVELARGNDNTHISMPEPCNKPCCGSLLTAFARMTISLTRKKPVAKCLNLEYSCLKCNPFHIRGDFQATQQPSVVPELGEFESSVPSETATRKERSHKTETSLPLKKRKLSVTKTEEEDDGEELGPELVEEILKRARAEEGIKEDISYPAKPMISIAELQDKLVDPQPRLFKTAAERKEMPPPLQLHPIDEASRVVGQYNNHTYNNPTINYHMNNVPYPFIPYPTSWSYFPSILLPVNGTAFDMNLPAQQQPLQQPAPVQQEPIYIPRKDKRKRAKKKNS